MLQSDEIRSRYRFVSLTTATGSALSIYNIPVKPSLFVVEDDPDISRLVRHHLENEGFIVRVYPTGANVLADAERQRPALFVLDIMVPGKDGLEICRTIRQTPGLASVPVIFLTAKSSEADRVLGLELGADDYIAKPFSPRELVARVKAVLRRFERPLPPSPMKVGDIEIDPSAMTLTVRGSRLPTTATEFRLLDYFARHKGRVFSRDHLLDSVWRDTAYVTPRSVDVYVRRIREKIEPDPENPALPQDRARRRISLRGPEMTTAPEQFRKTHWLRNQQRSSMVREAEGKYPRCRERAALQGPRQASPADLGFSPCSLGNSLS